MPKSLLIHALVYQIAPLAFAATTAGSMRAAQDPATARAKNDPQQTLPAIKRDMITAEGAR
jgi:hypothetical protein